MQVCKAKDKRKNTWKTAKIEYNFIKNTVGLCNCGLLSLNSSAFKGNVGIFLRTSYKDHVWRSSDFIFPSVYSVFTNKFSSQQLIIRSFFCIIMAENIVNPLVLSSCEPELGISVCYHSVNRQGP